MSSELFTEKDPVDIVEGLAKEIDQSFRSLRVEGAAGIAQSQYDTLRFIDENSPVTVNQLCDVRNSAKHTTSEVVSRLVKRGLVTKGLTPFDGRVVLLELTSAGKNLINRNRVKSRENYRKLVSRMTDEELGIFVESLKTILELFEKTSK